jgi:hypothetical protein
VASLSTFARALTFENFGQGEEKLWRAEEVADSDKTSAAKPGAMPQTTPSGQGVSLDDFKEKEDKYAAPMDCKISQKYSIL